MHKARRAFSDAQKEDKQGTFRDRPTRAREEYGRIRSYWLQPDELRRSQAGSGSLYTGQIRKGTGHLMSIRQKSGEEIQVS